MVESRYEKRMENGGYQYIADEIKKRFSGGSSSWAKKAVVIHKLIYRLDYHRSGKRVHTPSETLEARSGDCQDQSALVSNLFLAAGFDVRILSLTHLDDDIGHISVQVRVPDEKEKAVDHIRDTHQELFGTRPGKMAWSRVNGEPYFLADPEWSSYIGDRSSLTGDYVVEEGSSWSFYQIDDDWFVEADDGYCEFKAGELSCVQHSVKISQPL